MLYKQVKCQAVVSSQHMRVLLVRHGETQSNVERRLQGHYDTDLNEKGRKQASDAGRTLRQQEKIDAVYSSDLKRAFQTAELIANGKWDVIPAPKMRERYMGKVQNMLRTDAVKMASKEGKKLLDYGEGQEELTARLFEGYEEIVKDAEQKGYNTIIIVSHGSALAHLFKALQASPDYNTKPVDNIINSSYSNIYNCSVSIVEDKNFTQYAKKLATTFLTNADQ